LKERAKEILKEAGTEKYVLNIALKYKMLLIRYLEVWKNRNFKFLKDESILENEIIGLKKELERTNL